jgi:hypothetical protein
MKGGNVIAHTPNEQALVNKWFIDLEKLKKANSISKEQYDDIYDRYVEIRNMVADHINSAGKEIVDSAFSSLHNKFKGVKGGKKTRRNRNKKNKQRKTHRN